METPVPAPLPELIACSAGCGTKVESPKDAGWEYLPISRRYRCWPCGNQLRRGSQGLAPIIQEGTTVCSFCRFQLHLCLCSGDTHEMTTFGSLPKETP